VPAKIMLALFCGSIAVATAALLYALLRQLAVRPGMATCFTMFFCSTGPFVYWSEIPETHMAGGLSLLLGCILLTRPGRTSSLVTARSVLAFVIALSMVVTNVSAWFLARIDFDTPKGGGLRQFVGNLRDRVKPVVVEMILGLSLACVLYGVQRLLLNDSVGFQFDLARERYHAGWSWVGPILALKAFSFVGVSGWALLLDILGVAAAISAFFLIPSKFWLFPSFVVFGWLFHSFYDSSEAFLFSPNYTPFLVTTLALMAQRIPPRIVLPAVLVLTAVLLVFNFQELRDGFATLRVQGALIPL
jgi:hypothetical protein